MTELRVIDGGRRPGIDGSPGDTTIDRTRLLAELRALISRHAPRRRDGLQLAAATAPTAPSSSIARPTLAVVAQGVKRLALGDHVYDYAAGEFAVVTVDLPVTGHFAEASAVTPFLGVGLDLHPEVIASLLLDLPDVGAGTAHEPGIGVGSASAPLLDALVRRLRLLDAPDDERALAPLVEREIMWRLLTGPHGAIVRAIGLADSGVPHVGRTVTWIRENYVQPFRVEDLAELAGLSVSAYHRQFRALTTLSPIQFQKKIRLQQARILLLTRAETVIGAATAVGYDSASQFSREYRREFGLAPGRDALSLRSAPEGERLAALP